MSAPELGIVCKNCGAQASAYVTECPYCGERLRKRAPKLVRRGDEVAAKRSWRSKLPSLARPARPARPASPYDTDRPYATIAVIAVSAVAVIVDRAAGGSLTVLDLGALAGPFDTGSWRYLAAPFVYDDLGYLFVVAIAVAIFGGSLERRLGRPATVALILACGGLGMLAADGFEQVLGDGVFLAAGGNAGALGVLGAWYALERAGRKSSGFDDDADLIGAMVVAAVLLALPVVEDWANIWAGLAGGLGGLAAGSIAAATRRRSG